MFNNLPLYELLISDKVNDTLEVSYVALVDAPAIEKNFLAFNSAKPMLFIDEERHIISGPAMLADVPIFRREPLTGKEYYVIFKAPTIYLIAQKFLKKGYAENFNLFHDPKMKTQGVSLFELFITDSKRGILPMRGFEDSPEGSMFISALVDNSEIWGGVKSGAFKGFSVEGLFDMVELKAQKTEEEIFEDLKALFMGLNV